LVCFVHFSLSLIVRYYDVGPVYRAGQIIIADSQQEPHQRKDKCRPASQLPARIVTGIQGILNGCLSRFDGLEDWLAWSWNWKAEMDFGADERETLNPNSEMSTKRPGF
jgi:hypothetical protein